MKTAERIEKLLLENGIEKRKIKSSLAKVCGITPQAVYQWFNDSTGRISPDYLDKIARHWGTTTDYLISGVEPLQHPTSNADFDGHLSVWDSKTPLEADEVAVPFYTDVELAAGAGCHHVNEIPGPVIRFSKSTLRKAGVSPQSAACVRVVGTSMEPVLPDGTTIGVNTEATDITDGKMYAIDHDGMLRVKRLYNTPGGGLRIVSYNREEYPDELVYGYDVKKIRIIGQVFWYSVLVS